MNQEQVIYLLNAIILAMVGVIIIQQAKKKETKAVKPRLITKSVTPVVIQFESRYCEKDAKLRGLLPGEQEWQERREICLKITDHLFEEFMKKDSEFIHISNSFHGHVSGKIYILPINEQ